MEHSFFHFDRNPFVDTPPVRRLFWNPGQQRIMQAIAYGIEGRKGVTTLIGARGMGKTRLVESYLRRRRQSNIRTITISGAGCSFSSVLEELCKLCEIPVVEGDSDTTLRRLREALTREYAQGVRTVLILDAAESLALPVLEAILILADMKDESGSLVQIFLLAGPTLEDHLAQAGAAELRQRLGTPLVLQPFSPEESQAYVEHRIAGVAWGNETIFVPRALQRIIRYAEGNPGVLNYVCSEAMELAIIEQQKPINAAIVDEILGERGRDERVPWLRWGLAALAGVAVAVGLYLGGGDLVQWWVGSQPRAQTTAAVNEPVQVAAVDLQRRDRTTDGFTQSTRPEAAQLRHREPEHAAGKPDRPIAAERVPTLSTSTSGPSRAMPKSLSRVAGLPAQSPILEADRLTPQVPSLDEVDPQNSSLGVTPEGVKSVVCLTPRPTGNRRRDIILVDAEGKVRRRLVSDGALNLAPILSPDGRTLAYTSYREGAPSIYLRNLASSQEERLLLRPGFAMPGSWAPNGRYLVLSKSEVGNSDIFLYDTHRRHLRRLTLHKGIDISPSFAPDSKRLVFTSNRTGASQIYLTDVNGRPPIRLTSNGNYNTSAVWSPRGDTIAFIGRSEDQKLNIYTIRADGTGLRQVTQGDRTIEETPSWAPDGQSIMYTRVRNGIRERRIIRADGRADRELPGHGPVCYSPQWVAQN